MKIAPFFMLIILVASSCKQSDKEAEMAEDNIDAARKFIRYALDGKYDEAKLFMLQDSANLNYLEVAKRSYEKADPDTRNGYRASSINIHEVKDIAGDSVSTVIFSNSFKNDHDTLKIVRFGGKWLVDLKYLYEHGLDSTERNINKTDTLPR